MTVTAYHRNYGPIIPPFQPTYVQIVHECTEGNGNVCLELPDEKFCKKKLARPLEWCVPMPWWYLFCKQLLAAKSAIKHQPRPKTTAQTVHPFYRKMLNKVSDYKKGLTKANW